MKWTSITEIAEPAATKAFFLMEDLLSSYVLKHLWDMKFLLVL